LPVSGGWVLSIGFWSCLAASAVLFATVTLAPRWVARHDLKLEYNARQVRLLAVDAELQQLARVAEGLEHDPKFAAAVARHELRDPAEGELLPIDAALHYDLRARPVETVDFANNDAWYLPILRRLASSPELQRLWYGLAAGLLVFGFVFLHEHAGSRALTHAMTAPFRVFVSRYARSQELNSIRDLSENRGGGTAADRIPQATTRSTTPPEA
jgi:hypothetical protein